jgi:phage protein U
MRSIKVTVAIMAAAVSLTGGSAALAAGRHAHRFDVGAGGCRVTLNVAPRVITAGEAPLAFGHLACRGPNEEAGQTVTLYESSVSSPGFSVAGTTTTDAHGFYQISPAALTTNTVFYAVADSAQSGRRGVKVAAEVKLEGPPEGVVPTDLRTGRHNKVTFTGTVSPEDVGAVVVLQRQNAIRGEEWHRINPLATVNKEGKFTITHTFVVAGPANIRVVVRSERRNIPSPSNILTYEIVQAQNPALEIESSANPISYGQSTTISGVAKEAPNTTVELLARSAQQIGFTKVGEVKTDTTGHYTFPAQTPLVNTFYRVQGTGKSSAVLFEGVKYVLTAGASAPTVESGQSVTFSGAVSPAEAGHEIYLERANAAGTAYHVVQIGEVTAAGTYSIVHTFYGIGTSSMRIKIPGGPLNASTDSQAFKIEVTPAPPASLTPEAPGNSTLPPEGQV